MSLTLLLHYLLVSRMLVSSSGEAYAGETVGKSERTVRVMSVANDNSFLDPLQG